jgi:hypothetical protein
MDVPANTSEGGDNVDGARIEKRPSIGDEDARHDVDVEGDDDGG